MINVPSSSAFSTFTIYLSDQIAKHFVNLNSILHPVLNGADSLDSIFTNDTFVLDIHIRAVHTVSNAVVQCH